MTDAATLDDGWLARLKSFEGRAEYDELRSLDAVNEAMIRHWCDAMGDANPIYTDHAAAVAAGHSGIVAPPAMLQVWCMPLQVDRGRAVGEVPWHGHLPPASSTARHELWKLLDDAGFTSVVATTSDQEYVRYLRLGDRIALTSVIERISGEKRTALGRGHFVTIRYEYRDQAGELVGTMSSGLLKYAPAEKVTKPPRPRPAVTRDTAFWFDAARNGRLVIQRCAGCGRLRHPPGPSCPHCLSLEWDTVEASGRGTVYSYVVTHHPQVPAFDYPLVVAVIELAEGTRLVANVIECAPDDVHIGMAVECEMVRFDEQLTLPQFRPAR